MATMLKQSTAETIEFGPFVDKTDGDTEETALSLVAADILVSKNHAALTAKNDATNPTGGTNGHYQVTLDTTDTGTLGRLRVYCHKTGALSVWEDFEVVPANVYDSLVAGTDTLQADLTQMGGVAQSATDLKDFADAGYDPATNKVQGVVLCDTLTTYTGNTVQTADVAAVKTKTDFLPSATAGATGGVFIAGTNAATTITTGLTTTFTGNLTGSVASVTGAVGSVTGNVDGSIGSLGATAKTDVNAEVDTALNTAIPGTPTANSINERLAAVDDLTQAAGGGDLAAIKTVTDALPDAGALTTIGTDTARLTAARAEVLTDWINGGRLDLLLDAIPTTAMRGTDGANTTTPLSAAQVNAEVVDVLKTDTVAQLSQAAPPATPTLEEAVMYLYQYFRNKREQTATTVSMYDDAGTTVIAKSTISDDATTFTKGEFATGP